MIKTFLISFHLNNTYRVNTIIYALKKIPFIKQLVPSTLYKSHGLKVFANVVSVLWEIINVFLGKILYFWIMLYVPMMFFQIPYEQSFLHIVFFLTLIGAFFNTAMLSPSKDKYYAVILMKMDAKQFALSNYFYALIKHIIGYMIFIPLLVLNPGTQIPIWICFLIPIFVCSVKLVVMQYFLRDYIKNHNMHMESNQDKYTIIFAIVCLLCAYGLLFINYVMPIQVSFLLMTVFIGFGIYSLYFIYHYNYYQRLYHDLLLNVSTMINATSTQLVNENYHKMITLDTNLTSQKTGFEYFNEIFVKRHKRILWKSAKRQSYFIIVITLGICALLCFIPNVIDNAKESITMILPYFVFIMYLMNTTKGVTQAMFVNCDHSMLTYTFYRQPQNILALFKIRLRDMIKINLLPATLIAFGLVVILVIVDSHQLILNAVVSFVSVISMSIFFTTHYLVLYYLLQPFNSYTEVKNPVYSIIMSVTYLACYMFTRLQLPTLAFGITTIVFCIGYCIIACVLVSKYANRTFKIHD